VIVNAVDHGIETPDSRRSAGKPETGRIEIRAGITKDHLGESAIVIRIEDDGNGIDLKRLQAKNGGEGGLDLIFVDGLSSKALKNEYSGFGLGLGHVRAVIRRLGGEVDVERSDSAGTCIRINIPLTEKPIESKAS
jgi:two-component system chemotaxis sensor kinase CheA